MIKNTPPILPLLLFLMALTQTLQGQPKQKFITAYTDDFSGLKYEYGVGRYDYRYLSLSGTSSISSVRVPEGMRVTLYSEDNFRGQSLTLTKDTRKSELTAKGFANIMHNLSMIVEEVPDLPADSKIPSIVIYKDNFSGTNKRLTTGRFDMSELGDVGNDQISSVKVPAGFKVTLYEHQNFTGRSLVLTRDASADFLIRNKFNDQTTSLIVDAVAIDTTKTATPTIVVVGEIKTPVKENDAKSGTKEDNSPGVTIYQGDFSGELQKLTLGAFTPQKLSIGDNELSSIKITEGFRVTLFDRENFSGSSLVLEEQSANSAFLNEKGFNNVTSSILVELIPKVTIFEGAFDGASKNLSKGHYNLNELGIENDQLSSAKIPDGMWLLLFEHEAFGGNSMVLTKDTDPAYLRNRGFDNRTSSLVVGHGEYPHIIIHQNNFSGPSQKLTPGRYEYPEFEIGNNAISSVTIPSGMRVILYENNDFSGRSMRITRSVSDDFMNSQQFNNITSSLVVEWRRPEETVVTIYSDRFSGLSQTLAPGKYDTRDLKIGGKTLTSLRIPKGLSVSLFEKGNFSGMSYSAGRDTDFSTSKLFNDYFTSLIVEEISFAEVTPPTQTETVQKDTTTVPKEVIATPAILDQQPDCKFSENDYRTALQAVKNKMFSQEKMDMAKIVIKEKCLTNDQIREFAQQFDFEENTLEFLKYAYDYSTEKSTYYTLDSVLKFTSSKNSFMEFLKEK